ncbi:MAG: ACP S-malonyltransferase [Alphaproteobacteria bacterium]|nr:ACP S-malonyltransferase [Alphaproteobacteria bacterium]
MKIACVFPGQGSQKVGMCKELYDNSSVAKEIFEEVDEALGQNLSKIIFDGPSDDLTLTANTQPALMVTSIAILRTLEKEFGKQIHEFCDYVAGHSLGEFTALTATGSIKLSDCAKILRIRGQAMQDAVPFGKGAMFALLGANIDIAQDIAKEASTVGICQVANDNAPAQQVLSGEAEAIDKAIEIASAKGYKAIKLNVSAPFHSDMMKPAQEKLGEALENIEISKPRVDLIANVTADIIAHADIKNSLITQVTGMVRWNDSMAKLKELSVDTVAELGPGKVYTNLLKRIDTSMAASAVNDIESINHFINTIAATNN